MGWMHLWKETLLQKKKEAECPHQIERRNVWRDILTLFRHWGPYMGPTGCEQFCVFNVSVEINLFIQNITWSPPCFPWYSSLTPKSSAQTDKKKKSFQGIRIQTQKSMESPRTNATAFSTYRVQHEEIHSLPCGKSHQSCTAVERVTGSHNIAARLQGVLLGRLILCGLWKRRRNPSPGAAPQSSWNHKRKPY